VWLSHNSIYRWSDDEVGQGWAFGAALPYFMGGSSTASMNHIFALGRKTECLARFLLASPAIDLRPVAGRFDLHVGLLYNIKIIKHCNH
jgi:hypothetical protein